MSRGVVGKVCERDWRSWGRCFDGGVAESGGCRFCCCVSSSNAFVSLSARCCQWKAGREARAMKARGRWVDCWLGWRK
jgi:hypothetical protein